MITRITQFFRTHGATFILTGVLLYAGYLHGVGMFTYPYYESDEGTYASQAWSVLTQGKLAPYTYWYDHPPAGWLTLAAWYSILPDTFFTFGNAVNTGRVFMLILFLINTALVFYITKRLTTSVLASLLAAIFYASSPLTIIYSRRILLDNVQIFWLLASVAVLLPSVLSLRRYAFSGVLFGIAFLTKITAVMFGPALLYLVLTHTDKTHRGFRAFSWLTASGITVSFYFLYALIKSEFFPPLFKDSPPHVSFIESLKFQMGRGAEARFFESGSDFYQSFQEWILHDPFFIVVSIAAMAIGILSFYFVRNPWYRFLVFANLFFSLFLIRGGIVISFYFLPLTPFVSILVSAIVSGAGQQLGEFFSRITKVHAQEHVIRNMLVFLSILYVLGYYAVKDNREYFTQNDTQNQVAAIDWIKRNLPENTDIVIDSSMYIELHDPRYINDKVFENAEWFYKISRDPAVRDTKYNNDWRNLDYLALTHEMLKQIGFFAREDIVTQAFDNALPLNKWAKDSTAFIDEQKRRSTYGDWAMIYDINSNSLVRLEEAWDFYKKNYIVSYGQVLEPDTQITTSEGQAYAMLRAAWMNDYETFKGVWLWTQHHFQHRLDDKLLSWKWQGESLVDSNNATDADLDIALALLFGSARFPNAPEAQQQYLEDARVIIEDIWRKSVVDIGGTYYLIASDKKSAQVPNGVLLNPSYFSPAHYRLFAEIDTKHNWNKVADDTYVILDRLTRGYSTPLIRNWYVIDPATGVITDATNVHGQMANHFSYDSFRIFWRLHLDYAWFNNQKAYNYLERSGNYLERYTNDASIPTVIDPVSGNVISYEQSVAIVSSYLLPLNISAEPATVRRFVENRVEKFHSPGGYWGLKTTYYDQNWAWLHLGFFYNDLFNLWTLRDLR
jgi:endo-1,4-beta-D-glucanase Y/4-amino-4-deoxy-L-arabinose transferase-like glycosyltransferase